MKHQTLGPWVISTFVGLILDQFLYVQDFFWVKSLQKTCLCSWKITKKSFCQKRLYIFHFSTLWIWLFEIFDKCLQGQKLSRSSTGTTKSPIPGNHWVPLGCRALLGSVKPRQLMMSDRICCQTEYVVRRSMLANSQCCQTANIIRQAMLSESQSCQTVDMVWQYGNTSYVWNFRH